MATNNDQWFVGQRPVSEAFVGETKVYPAGGGVVYSQEFINCPTYYYNLKAGEILLDTSKFVLLYTDEIDRNLLKRGMNARVYDLTNDARETFYDLRSWGSDTGVYHEYEFGSGSGYHFTEPDLLRLDIYEVGVMPPKD